jgi:hypothetical protein
MSQISDELDCFVDEEELSFSQNELSFKIIIDKNSDYFSFESGLVVCICDGDVFVMHSFKKELEILGEELMAQNILPNRIDNLLGQVDFDRWSYAQGVSNDVGFESPYCESLVAEFSTKDGEIEAVREAVEFVRSLLPTDFVETMYSSGFVGFEFMDYESKPFESSSSVRHRIGRIREWNFKHIRIFVSDVKDSGDRISSETETVGKLYVDVDDVYLTESQVESEVKIVSTSESNVVGISEDERYEVGVVFNEKR